MTAAVSHHNECVQKMALYARRTECGVVGLQKHNANNIIANVSLAL
jgi:hypothetical protein